MTDIEKLKNLFTKFGIDFEETDNEIICRVTTVTTFTTSFNFSDWNGDFINMEVYE